MDSKKTVPISELPIASRLHDSDVLIIVQNNSEGDSYDARVSIGALRKAIMGPHTYLLAERKSED